MLDTGVMLSEGLSTCEAGLRIDEEFDVGVFCAGCYYALSVGVNGRDRTGLNLSSVSSRVDCPIGKLLLFLKVHSRSFGPHEISAIAISL